MEYENLIEKHKIGYKISYLKYREGLGYKEIAQKFNFSYYSARERHKKFLYDLLDFYIEGLKDMHIEVNKWELFDFYQSVFLIIAYLEKTYSTFLRFLRNNHPPIIPENYVYFPLYRKITEEKILEYEKYILEAVEQQKRKYADIGQELELSKEKTLNIYDNYYHKKVRTALDRIRPIVGDFIDEYIYNSSYSSYKRWKLIVSEYPELIEGLKD